MSDTYVRPKAILPIVLLGHVGAALAYLGVGYVTSDPSLSGLILVLGALICTLIYCNVSDYLIVRLIVAAVGSVGATVAFWGVWYALEFGWDVALEVAQEPPSAILEHLVDISNNYTYSVTSDSGVQTYGTDVTKALWITETVIYGVLPFVGALIGPRLAALTRRVTAQAQARRARR